MANPEMAQDLVKGKGRGDLPTHSSGSAFYSPQFSTNSDKNTPTMGVHPGAGPNQSHPLPHVPPSMDPMEEVESFWYERYKKQAEKMDEVWFQRLNDQNKHLEASYREIGNLTVRYSFTILLLVLTGF